MEKKSEVYETYVKILKDELLPAMGCTEPIAIAYAAAKAKDVLGCLPDHIYIGVSNNIIKNVKSVVVPNTGGLKGIEAACAAGIIAGKADKILEVISEVSDDQKLKIKNYIQEVPLKIEAIDNGEVFDIIIRLYKDDKSATVRLARFHTNIVYIAKDDEVLIKKDLDKAEANACFEDKSPTQTSASSSLTVMDILDFADTCDIEDIKDVIERQIEYNSKISEEGLKKDYGANIGKTMLKYYGDSIRNRAIAKAAAGSDARMSGCELPVIINSGSGNQGMTVSIPVIEYAKELNVSKEKLYRALVLANLIAIHEKDGIGRLSAYCGAVSAGCAAGCGIAYLYGADYDAIAHTLVNSLAIVSGIICDGAKASCAAKIASSVEAGILGYHMYLNGQQFLDGDGIVTKGVENTIKNIGRLGREGMKETDKEIVKIMLKE